MYLYSLSLQKPTGISNAIFGSFMGNPKEQEIVVGKGKTLELLKVDSSGKIQTVHSVEVFGAIRSIMQFRLTGSSKDLVIVGSDSGRIVVLEYNVEKNMFDKLHQETFGKSGCRRIVPGQFLAVDPKGRACMIGACEKQKFVYVLNRDNTARLTISSPLEAHKSQTIVFSLVGIDCGFDNPIFAAIELDYSRADEDSSGQAAAEAEKQLTYYELDLGLNHVVRKWAEPIDNGANMLVTVPGGADGPSGVLICAENFVIYKNQGHDDIRTIIPRRFDLPAARGVLIICSAMHKSKNGFFFLLQTEYGDVFKATLDYNKETDVVNELKLSYFDTIPVCSAICVLRVGLLFAAAEFGNHNLYRFTGLGDDSEVVSSSATLEETEEGYKPIFFYPRKLRNLVPIDHLESLMPMTDMKIDNIFDEETPQIFALCGRGSSNSLRILKPGLAVQEMAVSALPGKPVAVWTVKKKIIDEFDQYIVVSFANATLVLSIGETVEEVSDSGFLDTTPTLAASLLGEDSLMQAHPSGIRHIRSDGRINEWRTPGKKSIVCVGYNRMQVVISLSGGELVYFEMDSSGGGQLSEIAKSEMSGDVACLAVGPIPGDRIRSRFLAVGSYDRTVRLLSLDPDDCLQVLAIQSLSSPPESVLLVDTTLNPSSAFSETSLDSEPYSLFLNAGLQNGTLLRIEVDSVNGQLGDPRTRFLGLRAPKLFPCSMAGRPSVLCLSSRTWLGFPTGGSGGGGGTFQLSPLSYESLDYASSFSSDQCNEGIVAISEENLRVFSVDRLDDIFDQTVIPLRYTPRKFLVHKVEGEGGEEGAGGSSALIILEGQQGAFSTAELENFKAEALQNTGGNELENGGMQEEEEVEGEEVGSKDPLPTEQYGYPKQTPDKWVSCIRVLDPRTQKTTYLEELANSEAALSICSVQFTGNSSYSSGSYIAVGTATALQFWPKRECTQGAILIYRVVYGGENGMENGGELGAVEDVGYRLELVHRTALEGAPLALCGYRGKLLVGVGSTLRIYELGKRKLLRKCENKSFPNAIVTINVYGERIYVGDIQESFHFVKYRRDENQLYVFADDVAPRWLTCAVHVDFDTIAGADKFGNVFFVRLPGELSEEIEEDPTGGRVKWEAGRLNGASNKLEAVTHFHVGDVVTSLCKASLVPGGTESVLYGTMMGSVGALLPFASREDVDFFTHLEMHLRSEHPPLCGRDHMMYRSAYFPVKDVVDGDLCEQFSNLSMELQKKIAEELDRTVGEVVKKLEDMRNKII